MIVKEHPILFSAPMVRAILAGTKTQTRRVVKPVGKDEGFVIIERDDTSLWPFRSDDGESAFHTVKRGGAEYLDETPHDCPYGQPGDRLWVRENGWERPERTARMMRDGADTWEPYYYDADGITEQEAEDFKAWGFKRRPSIHMPRWASRILLEIVSVRIERLQDISEADAIAEGGTEALPGWWSHEGLQWNDPGPRDVFGGTAIDSYRILWQQINGIDSWDANPFVWVIEFKRVEG